MTEQLPTDVEAVLARITTVDRRPVQPRADATGALLDLLGWWLAVSRADDLHPVTLTPDKDRTAGAGAAMAAGIAAAERAVDAGATLIVPRVATRQDRAARTLIALLTRKDAATITFQAPGMTDRAWMAECLAVRDGVARLSDRRADPMGVLCELPAEDIAFVVGVLLASAARRTPCLVDGTDELAAALLADRMAFRATSWWRAGSTSPDPARMAAIERTGMQAGLPLDLTDDTGQGATATTTLLSVLLQH